MNHRRWKILPPPPAACLAGMGVPPLVAQLLYNRSITEPQQAEAFLNIEDSLQGDPFLLPDMDKAVARIYRALLSGEIIAVYGDYDADGVCGTATLIKGLSHLGGKVIPYLTHRLQDGYGLNLDSLEDLRKQGATLVITVDCGISNISEVEHAQKRGLDIIVTDHHSITHGLPPALAVINPKRTDPSYPFYQLAGVGVAFKLLQALFQALGRKDHLDELLDLVAIGTVADMVPLVGENRYLVEKGLDILGRTSCIGLQEMAYIAGLELSDLNPEIISWAITPRLNAPGRVDHALISYRLLVTDSPDEARYLAEELERKNTQRQKLTKEFLARARGQLPADVADSPLIMVGGKDYPSGIVGLIAGRLSDEFYRPAFVFEMGDNTISGSARSIPEFDVVSALQECRHLLLRFGGHPTAAGFALPAENLEYFQQCLLDMATRQLSSVDLRPSLTVEADIPLSSIQGRTFKLVERLAPFGRGNPVPALLSRRVRVLDSYTVGGGSQHLKMKVRDGEITWKALGFDLGHLAAEVTSEIDVVYNLAVDRWNGEEVLALNILDFAPA